MKKNMFILQRILDRDELGHSNGEQGKRTLGNKKVFQSTTDYGD